MTATNHRPRLRPGSARDQTNGPAEENDRSDRARAAHRRITETTRALTGETVLQPPGDEAGGDVEDLLNHFEDVAVAIPVFPNELCRHSIQHLVEYERGDDD